MQIWALKYTWTEMYSSNCMVGDPDLRHLIVQTLGPYSMSACGIVALEDRANGWGDFRPYKNIRKNKDICGKCLSAIKFKEIDKPNEEFESGK
jgi:hypothetical protein